MDRFKHFISGFASAFDMWGSSVVIPDLSRGFERDSQSLRGDWRKVGNDIRNQMNTRILNGK